MANRYDVIIIGGGHNGLVAAAYLARAGRSVLVLERREQLGGACTIERPFADERYLVPPSPPGSTSASKSAARNPFAMAAARLLSR